MSLIDRGAIRFVEQFEALNLWLAESEMPEINVATDQDINALEVQMQEIAQKAGSTLTHISLMVAIALFVIQGADTSLFETIIVSVEVFLYLWMALVCLTCLYFHDTRSERTGEQTWRSGTTVRASSLLRRVLRTAPLQNFATRWTLLISFIFMLSLIVHIIL